MWRASNLNINDEATCIQKSEWPWRDKKLHMYTNLDTYYDTKPTSLRIVRSRMDDSEIHDPRDSEATPVITL